MSGAASPRRRTRRCSGSAAASSKGRPRGLASCRERPGSFCSVCAKRPASCSTATQVTLAELLAADEVLLVGTTTEVLSLVTIDGQTDRRRSSRSGGPPSPARIPDRGRSMAGLGAGLSRRCQRPCPMSMTRVPDGEPPTSTTRSRPTSGASPCRARRCAWWSCRSGRSNRSSPSSDRWRTCWPARTRTVEDVVVAFRGARGLESCPGAGDGRIDRSARPGHDARRPPGPRRISTRCWRRSTIATTSSASVRTSSRSGSGDGWRDWPGSSVFAVPVRDVHSPCRLHRAEKLAGDRRSSRRRRSWTSRSWPRRPSWAT